MTRRKSSAAAHALLDRARDGARVSAAMITEALVATGDLRPDHAETLQVVVPQDAWRRRNTEGLAPASWFAPIQ